MRSALAIAGNSLVCLGDGEPWRGYVIYLSESLRAEPDIRVAKEGGWSSFTDRTVLAKRRPWSHLPGLDRHLRYAQFAGRSLPVLRWLRGEYGRDDLPLLAGVPSPLTVSAVLFGVPGPILYRRAVRRATAREIARIHQLGQDVVVQIELPAETVAVARAPRALQRHAARLLAADVHRLVRTIPAGTRMAVHLCLGSLHGQPAYLPQTLMPLVDLANALARGWPADRGLELVHLPVTTVVDRARLDQEFYAPLTRLDLPTGTHLAAGLVTAQRPEREQALALRHIRAATPAAIPLHVSPPCGLLSEAESDAGLVVHRAFRLAQALGSGFEVDDVWLGGDARADAG